MYEGQSPLGQCAFLLSASVSHGLDEALRSTRSSMQARQMPQRIAYKDHGSMFPNAYESPYAIGIEAQRPFAVLMENWLSRNSRENRTSFGCRSNISNGLARRESEL
jgi:hypothetical protein